MDKAMTGTRRSREFKNDLIFMFSASDWLSESVVLQFGF